MTAAKRIALDKNSTGAAMALGAQIARSDLRDTAYREQFIRASLTSHEPIITAVGFSYLQQEESPRRFLSESVRAYEHLPFEYRMILISLMFYKNSPADMHAEEFDELLQMAGRDKNEVVQKLARHFQHELSTRAESR
jgi:hypothetical protein